MQNPLDNSLRAKNALICFYIVLGAYILMAISDFMEYQLLTGSSRISLSTIESNNQRQLIIGVLAIGAQLALIITFIQWFRRAYHNLHKVGEKNLLTSEGWAAGAWFVPIVSLFRPYQIMVEIWDRTKKYNDVNQTNAYGADSEFESNKQSVNSSVVILWWLFWIACSITANISNYIARKAIGLDDFLNANKLGLTADIAGVIAILLAVRMIQASQRDQDIFFKTWKEKGDSASISLAESDEILV